MPSYDFHERHEVMIQAPTGRVQQALISISFADVGVMQMLVSVRAICDGAVPETSFGRRSARMPILEMMSDPRSGFFALDETDGELVFGLAGQPWNNKPVRLKANEFWAWAQPDNGKIAVNFLLEDAGDGRSRAVRDARRRE